MPVMPGGSTNAAAAHQLQLEHAWQAVKDYILIMTPSQLLQILVLRMKHDSKTSAKCRMTCRIHYLAG